MKATLLAMLAFAVSAPAATMGYKLDLMMNGSGFPFTVNSNTPLVRVTNTGDVDITAFTLTIGNTAMNFDFIAGLRAPGVTVLSTNPVITNHNDDNNDGTTTDTLSFAFSDFNPTESIMFQTDIDPDTTSNWTQDFRSVMIGRSVATFTYANGIVLTRLLETQTPVNGTYSYAYETPEPGTMALAGTVMVGLVALSRRRKQA